MSKNKPFVIFALQFLHLFVILSDKNLEISKIILIFATSKVNN